MLQPALRVWLATSLLFPIHDSLSAQTRPLAARGTFSTAPRIGGREFFERVGAVQLSVRTGPAFSRTRHASGWRRWRAMRSPRAEYASSNADGARPEPAGQFDDDFRQSLDDGAVDLRISLLGEAARHVDAADLRGATIQSGAGQELLVEVGVTRGQTIGMPYYPIVGHVRLREYDTVFALDGALVRSNAGTSSFGFSATGIHTTKAADLDQLTGDLLDSFVLRVSATR